MGLTVAVGLYAQNLLEEDDEAGFFEEPFDMLNEVLEEQGLAPHEEPKSIPQDQYFEAQMWGYSGLHALRRLAAYLALKRTLPPRGAEYGAYAQDPVLEQFQSKHDRYFQNREKPKIFGIFGGALPRPPFQHLLYHSDAEGFYLPRDFGDVVIDYTEPQRPGLGMMIGSSIRLLDECLALCRHIDLPEDFDPESDEFLEIMENAPNEGPLWHIYHVEAHSLGNLIRASKVSIELNAAIQFT